MRTKCALYNIDCKNSIRWCPKLTNAHLHPKNFQKMKVKLATQILSHTLASAIFMAVSGCLLPPSAVGTAELIDQLHKTFDCLSSSSFQTPKIYNHPVLSQSHHIKFMTDMCSLVGRIIVKDPASGKDVTSSLKCSNALHRKRNTSSVEFSSVIISVFVHQKAQSRPTGKFLWLCTITGW